MAADSKLQHALALAAEGFHVFPLIEEGKLPAIDAFPTKATRDPARIKAWWTCPVLGIELDRNVGISTSKFGEDKALLVVDVDNKKGKKGDDELLRLEIEGNDFPATRRQSTPTGGAHLVYVVDQPVKQGANVLAPGLDVRSNGGYIVGRGSHVPDGLYGADDAPLSPAPQWLVDRCGRESRPVHDKQRSSGEHVDPARARKRALEYLTNAPLAIEGQGGDQTTFAVAARLKDLGVDQEEAINLLDNHWNERCSPPWGYDQLCEKVMNAYRYGKETPGSAAPEVQFPPVHTPQGIKEEYTPEGITEPGSYLEQINKDHALVYVEGSHFILHETIDERGRPKRVFLTEPAFRRKFSAHKVMDGKKTISHAESWLDWKGRREYQGVCFAPGRDPRNGYYNLWRGFAVEPKPYEEVSKQGQRGVDALLDHVRDNICRGDKALSTWLLGYFAHIFQRPYERPLTTIVFRGTKGVGKNAVLDRVGRLLGSGHYLVAHDGRYLTSNFNGHLDSCLCLVLDEAFWSGDKAAEGKLKGLTTAPEILIERKGKEAYMVDNLVRLFVFGNEDWLVPASSDERRYAVFDIGEGRKQDREFFKQMRIDLDESDGGAALLHFFLTFDLSTVDVNAAPTTAALLDQKHASLDPLEQWWLDCLSEGHIVGSDFGGEWPERIETERFQAAFRRYAKDRNVRARVPDVRSIGRLLAKRCPGAGKKRLTVGDKLQNIYVLPTLEVARNGWEKHIGHKVGWE